MQLGSFEINTADLAELGISSGSLQVPKTPAELSNAKSVYKKAKQDFERALNEAKPRDDELKKLLERFNELSDAFNIELRFSIDQDSPKHISVKVINTKTNEIIREVPPQKFSFVGSKFLGIVGVVIDKIA